MHNNPFPVGKMNKLEGRESNTKAWIIFTLFSVGRIEHPYRLFMFTQLRSRFGSFLPYTYEEVRTNLLYLIVSIIHMRNGFLTKKENFVSPTIKIYLYLTNIDDPDVLLKDKIKNFEGSINIEMNLLDNSLDKELQKILLDFSTYSTLKYAENLLNYKMKQYFLCTT